MLEFSQLALVEQTFQHTCLADVKKFGRKYLKKYEVINYKVCINERKFNFNDVRNCNEKHF